jgi:soluble lytic murein transglycosylase-like protein
MLGMALLAAAPTFAGNDDIHVYRDRNGTRLFTDQKVNYRISDTQYDYIGTYGRPTAYLSCQGLTPQGLEARGDQYQHYIDRHSRAYGVDPALVRAVMRVESCFDVAAVSRVGAQGLMQLMPYTAEKLGVSDSFDPDENIRGGVQYLSRMLKRFNHNTEYAIAAYNAGPLNVEKYKGIPPFAETKSYTKRVMAQYKRYSS